MNLQDAERLAKEEIDKWLGDLQIPWTFGWNNRKRAFGVCNYKLKKIILSKPLTEVETEKQVLDTIRHEIAHALTPGAGHGYQWKAWAMKIGASTDRCATFSEGVELNIDPKYVLVCPMNKICKKYYKKPNEKTFQKLKFMYIPGRRQDTLGKMKIIEYKEYLEIR